MNLSEEQLARCRRLLARARKHLVNAYVPHSKFPVATMILTTDGQEFAGVNIENDSYGLSLCAERAALAAMVTSLGASARIAILAIAGARANPCYPCGACRQALLPFVAEDALVALMAEGGEGMETMRFLDLLPLPFRFESDTQQAP